MIDLTQDLQDLIEPDHAVHFAVLTGPIARMPRSVEPQWLSARAHLRALEVARGLMDSQKASALDPNNVDVLNQICLCPVTIGGVSVRARMSERHVQLIVAATCRCALENGLPDENIEGLSERRPPPPRREARSEIALRGGFELL